MIGFNSIPISAILDCVYCKRRWYLRNAERNISSENEYMTIGTIQHEYVSKCHSEVINGVFTITNVLVYSELYNMIGLCDTIELFRDSDGVKTPYCDYRVNIVPVEYKHGKVRMCNEYMSQVAAQAMCLEEMYRCRIDRGCIYFVDANERFTVEIDDKLRKTVTDAVDFIKGYDFELIKPSYSRKCRGCSMFDICDPREINIHDYLNILWDGDESCSV